MLQFSRRTFIRSSACASAAVVAAGALSADRRANASEVTGYNYRLPNIRKGATLLFQGDSITDMKWGRNQGDRNHYLGHSYVYLIASRLGVDMPEAGLEFFNRGISGNKVGDLRQRWQKDAIDMKPDLLSILIGVNDVSKGGGKPVPLESWEGDYRHILDASRKANPKLRVVLQDPFVLKCGRLADDEAWKHWRGEIDRQREVVARLAQDYDAVHVQLQEVFDAAAAAVNPEQWIWDGVHPLPQGHELIARNWLQQVSA